MSSPSAIVYQYSLNTEKVTANTVIHRHANIRKSLQYAVKIGLINYNPADRVERPRKQKYVASFYNEQELETLFAAVKGNKSALSVALQSLYHSNCAVSYIFQST